VVASVDCGLPLGIVTTSSSRVIFAKRRRMAPGPGETPPSTCGTLRRDTRRGRRSSRDAAAAALDNATAVPLAPTMGALYDGPTEVPRRELTRADIEAVLTAEIEERLAAAAEYERLGHGERAGSLRRGAAVIQETLYRVEGSRLTRKHHARRAAASIAAMSSFTIFIIASPTRFAFFHRWDPLAARAAVWA